VDELVLPQVGNEETLNDISQAPTIDVLYSHYGFVTPLPFPTLAGDALNFKDRAELYTPPPILPDSDQTVGLRSDSDGNPIGVRQSDQNLIGVRPEDLTSDLDQTFDHFQMFIGLPSDSDWTPVRT
jgi:hypothetical protein